MRLRGTGAGRRGSGRAGRVAGGVVLGAALLLPVATGAQAPPTPITHIRCDSTVNTTTTTTAPMGTRYTSRYALNAERRSVQEYITAENQWRLWSTTEFTATRLAASRAVANACTMTILIDRVSGAYRRTTTCPSGVTLSHQGTCNRAEPPTQQPRF